MKDSKTITITSKQTIQIEALLNRLKALHGEAHL